ncbi:iron-sulfur cluster repair protein YtfE [Pseudomonas songnenensis]|jgi:regulator of cell morphogenesis and NO signaling|uniref:iron-sulfur cluster repair protein YtfE n=1 Tax=Pseudomonas songnenensis TaxID=1176259 RepID=UPI0028B01AF5|nr:iron-sulfur cluster repair protein YtfE [Pseudomonas songnenensis]
MTTALIDQTLGNLACSVPGATRVFRQYRLDFCCGGELPLREAAQRIGVDPETIAAALLALEPNAEEQDWRTASAGQLIEYILARFHERHRDQFPELIRLASRVEQVHGSRPECPNGLAEHLWNMQQELESHMLKEEQILFPMLQRGMGFPQAQGPISVMRYEHQEHGNALERLAALTDDITPPANACNTWRALYRGLEEMRSDLMQHIHLENNVLFRNAEAPARIPTVQVTESAEEVRP